ncbi:mycothiol system anti-sigma-R factor [Kitasatospora aureofaciens]|uniref:mycothiol system anti-sigma-R factor n=1 Tax=Kitasatospora aureofaciens TaxID=1894 RepID=UPI001DB81903|nr:mycothiol system anti-sigma-R factor [Kitasatospora aureofaciens]HJD80447.1 mycothiol system anti-sigma-R factor [Kitasatospora aureofaciens]
MSCGDPHETECGEVLDHLYEFLDNEMAEGDCAKLRVHFEECSPCLKQYGLEQAIKALIKRSCGCDDTPADLRGKVLARIDSIRAGQRSGEQVVVAVESSVELHADSARPAPKPEKDGAPSAAQGGASEAQDGASEERAARPGAPVEAGAPAE